MTPATIKKNKYNVQKNETFLFTNKFGNVFQLFIVDLKDRHLEVRRLDNATGEYEPQSSFIGWDIFNTYMNKFSPLQVL